MTVDARRIAAQAAIDARKVAVGSRRFLETLGPVPKTLADRADALRTEGKTALYAAIDGRTLSVIAVADPIKETTPEAIKALRAEGVRVVMLSGDSRKTAEAVGRQLGIVKAIRLSHATMRNVRQNLFFAFIYNALGVPIAAGVLYPAFGLRRVRL